MKALFRAATIGALLVAGSAGAALAQTAPTSAADTLFRATTLSLSAYGEVNRAPDMATISLGVQTEAPTAAEAMRLNAVKMNQVIRKQALVTFQFLPSLSRFFLHGLIRQVLRASCSAPSRTSVRPTSDARCTKHATRLGFLACVRTTSDTQPRPLT